MRIAKSLTISAALAGIVAAGDSQHRTLIDRSPATNAYVQYTGNGSPEAGWPKANEFLDFETLWGLHEAGITADCKNEGQPALSQTATETAQLKAAILAVNQETGYDDPAGILTQVLLESSGCLRVETTVGEYRNPGILQSCNGAGTCFAQAQCPYEEIAQMVRDGVAWNPKTSSLLDARKIAGGDPKEAMTLYRAARIYNSGMTSIQPQANGDLWRPGMFGKKCYASNYANIRVGYVGVSPCKDEN